MRIADEVLNEAFTQVVIEMVKVASSRQIRKGKVKPSSVSGKPSLTVNYEGFRMARENHSILHT